MALFGTAFQLRFQFKQMLVASLQKFVHFGENITTWCMALQAALSDEVEWGSHLALATRPRPRRLQTWVFTPWRSADLYYEGDFSLLLFEWCQTETFSSTGGLLDLSVFLDFLWLSSTNCSFLDPDWASIVVFQPRQRSRAFARHDRELVTYKNM